MMKITAFLPCRAGSQRIPKKNTKPFAGIEGGLLSIKLEQLVACSVIDQIVLSTNDEEVISIAKKIAHPKIKLDRRPEHLASSSTSTDDLVKYVPTIIQEGHVLWTHVTSPFIDASVYEKAIKLYEEGVNSQTYDSLMSVAPLQTFIWNKDGAINYDRKQEQWPRTQTIEPLYEIDSGMFITSIEVYKNLQDRIGECPLLFENDKISSFDIDWEDDFFIAETMYKKLRQQ